MTRTLARSTVAAGILSVSMLAMPAFAHGHGHAPMVRYTGVVTAVPKGANQQLTLQANGASVTVNVDARTIVLSTIFGSTNDLVQGARVDLHILKGTTVDAVRIAPPPRRRHLPHLMQRPDYGFMSVRSGPHVARHVNTSGQHSQSSAEVDGVIQTFNRSTNALTLLMHGGKTTVYAVTDNVKVTKIVNGSLSDLSVGQRIQVFANRSTNMAASITINNS